MIVEGTVLALPRANVDTDQIIPAHRLTGISKSGMSRYLFDGMPDGPALLASRPGAAILVARENFGCGSSREHAVWALRDAGFRAVIAPSFARIFQENAYIGGLAPLTVTGDAFEAALRAESIRIDLSAESFRVDGDPTVFTFAIDPMRKAFITGGSFMHWLAAKRPVVHTWLATHPRP